MTPAEINNSFQKTLALWEHAITAYTDDDFARRPNETSWSIGQLCQHLISSADNFAFMNIRKCLLGSEHEHEQKNETGVKIFVANKLPNVPIKGFATAENTPQPESKEAVKSAFKNIGERFSELAARVSVQQPAGKEKHYAFGYLDATEWLQYTDVHFRHHLHQKDRLDTFLKS